MSTASISGQGPQQVIKNAAAQEIESYRNTPEYSTLEELPPIIDTLTNEYPADAQITFTASVTTNGENAMNCNLNVSVSPPPATDF